MPSLLHIPIPVAATWSVRTDRKDKYGIYQRWHYLQLYEEKFHDPDLSEIDLEYNYKKNSIPEWMIPEFLPNDTLRNLIRYHPDIASVRYRQERFLMPSYRGVLFSVGYSYFVNSSENVSGILLGLGWGFADELLFMLNKPSIGISTMYLYNDIEQWLLMADFGFGINLPLFGIFKPRFDFGYVWGFQTPYNESAGKYSVGLDSETILLGATYSGLTFRFKYQWINFNNNLHGPVLEIILH